MSLRAVVQTAVRDESKTHRMMRVTVSDDGAMHALWIVVLPNGQRRQVSVPVSAALATTITGRAAFGDAAPAAKGPPSAKTRIPESPSDIGGFNSAPSRLSAEALEALPQEELMARMATMSSAQIEELLSQADF